MQIDTQMFKKAICQISWKARAYGYADVAAAGMEQIRTLRLLEATHELIGEKLIYKEALGFEEYIAERPQMIPVINIILSPANMDGDDKTAVKEALRKAGCSDSDINSMIQEVLEERAQKQ